MRVHQLPGLVNRAPNDKASVVQPSLHTSSSRIPIASTAGRAPGGFISDGRSQKDSPLCIKSSTIIRQSSCPIASGGLGDVYKCTWICDAGPDEVAIKSPRFMPNLSTGEAVRINQSLDREIRIWAVLEHQYVLPLYGVVEGFGPFRALVSPWMPNGTLSSYLSRAGVTLTIIDKFRILKQITEGLKYLHDNDVIHGDLTSNNVLIAADGSPRLADFGISNIIMESNPAFPPYGAGNIRWLAPECIFAPEEQSTQYATKSGDIYALGGIILQVLYGKQPYWWLERTFHLITARFKHMEPVNSSIQIQPIHLYFMRRCWSVEKEVRPSVVEVVEFLQMCEQARSGESAKRRGEGRASMESPARPTRKTRPKNPPSYGAQQRQDILWKGGNKALPPSWHRFDVGDGNTLYQDNNIFMASYERPLPGVRLDRPGYLRVPGCEWHISPLGRSYFVNHNTRTTSWKIPTPEHPPGSLTPERIMDGHSKLISSFAYVGTSNSVLSASADGSIRQWTRDGKTIGQPWRSDGGGVASIAVSPDEKMVVSGSADGRVRLWNIKEGKMVGYLWKGHNAPMMCLDWSPNAQEVISGSRDGTIRRWNPDTGRQIAPPIEAGQGWLYTVKYSPQGDKFASGGLDDMIRVWSKDGELLIEIKGHKSWVVSLCWSKDGTRIFSGSGDRTIRKWRAIDGKELIVLRGHTNVIVSLCLSLDECYLVSASRDSSVRIWDLETNQLVGVPLWHDNELLTLAMSPDGKSVASAGFGHRIYLWNFEAALKQGGNQNVYDGNAHSDAKLKELVPPSGNVLDVFIKPPQLAKNGGSARYGDDFWGNDTSRNLRDSAPLANPSRPLRNLVDFLRFNPQPRKEKQLEPNREALGVVDVPFRPATYGDYRASKEDGIRPYSLLFCLSWFQKREKKPDPPPQLYDVDLMKAEQEDDIPDIPIPTIRDRFGQQEEVELRTMASQSQPEAGPSRLLEDEGRSSGLLS